MDPKFPPSNGQGKKRRKEKRDRKTEKTRRKEMNLGRQIDVENET